MSFVLVEVLSTSRVGHPVYFRSHSSIGPMCAQKFSLAQRFETKTEAMMDPAYSFGLTFFEPFSASEDEIWDTLTSPTGD